ncbi:MAG: C69 family dipeptidase [Clostridiales Family XIII bacterium]|jgi:dipeptidase|nr:C69 family dipeptidase [Clostridiales Family XIII bacterium]
MKKKATRIIVAVATAALLLASTTAGTFACTGIYFGKGTTENGSVMWGRSEDISARYSKILTVHPAESHEPGDMYASSTGFKWPYPAQTLRYTLAKDSVFNENITPEPYAEVGINEKNVAISATVTISGAKSAITNIDGMVRASNGGLIETDLATVVLMNAETARGAIELVAQILDTKGAGGREAFTVSDPNEVWYMEILSGHQYAAVKAPEDKIAFSPNITMLGAIDVTDEENVIVSPAFVETAEKAGTLVTDELGRVRVAESYANQPGSPSGRMYLGYYYLKGVEAALALKAGYHEYYIDPRPEMGYTLYEAMRFLAYHGNPDDKENGKYNANPTGNGSAIGNAGTVEAHIFETRDGMPADLATVEWIAMGPAEFSVYLPYYSLTTETHESYWNADSKTFNPDSFYWVFRELFTLSNANRNEVAEGVLAFWEAYQKSLIDQQAAVDEEMQRIYAASPELAQVKATELSKAVAGQTFENARQLLGEVQAYIADGKKGEFVPTLLEKGVLPDYTFTAVGGTGLPGQFSVIADKATRKVMVRGTGYEPNETLSLRVAYNSNPTPGSNEYEAQVQADGSGVIEAEIPAEVTASAPWLGGESYDVYLGGVRKSGMLKATYAKLNETTRIQLQIKPAKKDVTINAEKDPNVLDMIVDGVAYEIKSSNPSIVSVSQDGVMTPRRAGTATISLRTTDGSDMVSSVVVTVRP